MTSLVVDASVAAKWFLHEADAAKALALLTSGLDLKAPAVARYEVAAAIVRAYRNARIGRPKAEQLLAKASNMLSSAAVQLADVAPLQTRAQTIALDVKHALVDCFYIALAESLGCELVTADATLLACAQAQFAFVKPL